MATRLFWTTIGVLAAMTSTSSAMMSMSSERSAVTRVYSTIDDVRAGTRGICKTVKVSGLKDHPIVDERCPSGPDNWQVSMFSADARSAVSFGRLAKDGASVMEALDGAFADPHHTIEWRLRDGQPFAAIHRYFIEGKSVLLVHRLQPDKTSCVAAVVTPRSGRNANEEAADIADRIASTFRCGHDRLMKDGRPV